MVLHQPPMKHRFLVLGREHSIPPWNSRGFVTAPRNPQVANGLCHSSSAEAADVVRNEKWCFAPTRPSRTTALRCRGPSAKPQLFLGDARFHEAQRFGCGTVTALTLVVGAREVASGRPAIRLLVSREALFFFFLFPRSRLFVCYWLLGRDETKILVREQL